MKTPERPANEEQRLAALRGLRLLDTLPEERFDRITRLAQRLLHVPIALISLVDEERQWFKSCQGMTIPGTSRDISFCGHALGQAMLVVPDTFADDRFADNPMVTGEPHIRFYAGVVLFSTDGMPVGTLCVKDHVPRQMTPEESACLNDLAAIAQQEIRRRVMPVESMEEVLEAVPSAIFIKDSRHRWVVCNEAFCALVGHPREFLLGKSDYDFFPKEQADLFWSKDEEVMRHDASVMNEEPITDGNGRQRWLLTLKTPCRLRNDEPGIVAIITDITARKHAEEALRFSEMRQRAILENSSDGVILMGADGHFLWASRSAARMFGYAEADMVGMDGFRIVHPRDHDVTRQALGKVQLATEKPVRLDFCGVRKDGSEFYLAGLGTNRLDVPGINAVIINLRDVTDRRQAQRELHLNEQRWKSLITNTNDIIYILTPDGVFTFLSPNVLPLMGYEVSELVGTAFPPLIHPDDLEGCVTYLEKAFTGDAPREGVEYRIKRKEGSWSWQRSAGSPVFDENGNALLMLGIATDITAKKKAEEELRFSELRFRTVARATSDIIWDWDLVTQAHWWNDGFLTHLGYTEEERSRGVTSWQEHIHPEDRERVVRCINNVVRGGEDYWSDEYRYQKKNGEYIDVFDRGFILRDETGAPLRMIGGMVDVTAQKQANRELVRAKEVAESANRAKSEFLANMSHEIRTPMNGIMGMTELALDTELTDEQREYIELVRSSADALLVVINDILDFSKIEAGKLEIHPEQFDLRSTCGDIVRSFALRAREKGLDLDYTLDPLVPELVVSDPHRLGQVLTNLMGNALKFTERGGVTLSIRPLSQQVAPDHVMLSFAVADTGIGIPPEKRKMIFDPFSQADASTTRVYGGTGLGLTISAKLVHLMGGDIWVESEPGKGSTFHFTITAAIPKPSLESQLRVELPGMAVLVADDNTTSRMLIEEMLLNWRMRPMSVTNGREALSEMRRARDAGDPYALVILDAYMPVLDGFGVAETISKDPTLAGAVVMMHSLIDDSLSIDRSRKNGAHAILMKPVTQSGFLNTIMRAIGSRHLDPSSGDARHDVHKNGTHHPLRPMHILLAEDNPVNQRVAMKVLTKHGHSVLLVNNGQEAVEAYKREVFDLILMDVQMPVMDGFHATRAIRRAEQENGRHTPIIAMTAHALKGDRERCLQAGMDSYVSKPVRPEELFEVMAESSERYPARMEEGAGTTGSSAQRNREMFLQDVPFLLADIKGAIDHKNADWILTSTRTLGDALVKLGENPAADIATRLEAAAKVGDTAQQVLLFEDLSRCLLKPTGETRESV